MATFRSAAALADHQSKRAVAVQKSMRIEHKELTGKMKAKAIALTGGTLSIQTLRRMNHPYARRHGAALTALLPINRQSGRLQRSLKVGRRRRKGEESYSLHFTAPYAKYVLSPTGTRFMLPRGFWQALGFYYKRYALPSYLKRKRAAEQGR